jgi:hypothetical protein
VVRTFSDQFSINALDPNSPNFSVKTQMSSSGRFSLPTRH